MPGAIDLQRNGSVAVVTICRPEVRNALGPRQALELSEAVAAASADSSCLGIVLTGDGVFSAGGDLPAIMEMIEGRRPEEVASHVYDNFQAMARSLRDSPIPTVAAVGGAAIGLGLDLALWCDTRFLGPKAKLAQGWASLGLIPGTGGAALLQGMAPGEIWHLIGSAPMDAQAAANLGLGVLADDPISSAVELIESWDKVGRAALEGYATLTRGALPDDAYLRKCAQIQGELLTSDRFVDFAKAVLRQ